MEDLNSLREEIDKIDKNLLQLFNKRMEIVSKVAEYKIENHMEILDEQREEQIINRHLSNIQDKSQQENIKEFLQSLMSISKKIQKKIMYKAEYKCLNNDFKISDHKKL